MTTTECKLRHHSPKFSAGSWRCPDCTNNVRQNEQAAAISRAMEARDRGMSVAVAAPVEGKVTAEDWRTFTLALRRCVGADGRVHQRDMRPLIRGRIRSQLIPSLYRKAIKDGLISEVTRERSDDARGRNTNKDEPVYLLSAA